MKTGALNPRPVAGYMLLEVLVSLVIFSIGVLGVVAMQAISIKADGAAKYRADASLLANELIGRMWADDRTPANLQAAYQGSGGSGGPKYVEWFNEIGGGSGSYYLPHVAEVPPEVQVEVKPGNIPPQTAKSLVTIKVHWKIPGDKAPDGTDIVHTQVAVAEIK